MSLIIPQSRGLHVFAAVDIFEVMPIEGEPKYGFKNEISRVVNRFRLRARESSSKSKTDICFPPEEIGGLFCGTDRLKMNDVYRGEEQDGSLNYRVSLKGKDIKGISGVFRSLLFLEEDKGRLEVNFSFDQSDFEVVRRSVVVEHNGRKIELAVCPNRPRCELNLEYPGGSELFISEEDKALLASDFSRVIRVGLSKLSVGRAGSS